MVENIYDMIKVCKDGTSSTNTIFVVRRKKMDNRENLSSEFIDDVLSIYKSEHRYINEAQYNDGILTCKLKPTKYPYTTEPIFDYITSVTATLFVCQLTYVLFAQLVKENKVPSLSDSIEEFLSLRDGAKLKFLRFNFKFINKVINQENIDAKMTFVETINKKNKQFYKSIFFIGDGIKGELITTVDKS